VFVLVPVVLMAYSSFLQAWFVPCSCPDSMYKAREYHCVDPLCNFAFLIVFQGMHPNPNNPDACFLSAVSPNKKSFMKRNCATFDTPFLKAAQRLEFSPKRLARVSAYSGRRTGITLCHQAGVHPGMIELTSKHDSKGSSVGTTWDYNDPKVAAALPQHCAAPLAMSLIAKRFRYFMKLGVWPENSGSRVRLFDGMSPLTFISRAMIQAVDNGTAHLLVA
jgi:hypothetical protein